MPTARRRRRSDQPYERTIGPPQPPPRPNPGLTRGGYGPRPFPDQRFIPELPLPNPAEQPSRFIPELPLPPGVQPPGDGYRREGPSLGRQGRRQARRMGLPLDPQFEMGRRGLEDELLAALSGIGSQRGQVSSLADLVGQRLGTNETREKTSADENFVGRGIFRSGVRDEGIQKIGGAYDRQRQDLAFDTANQLSGLGQAESEARLGYTRGLQELLAELARRTATNPNAPMGRGRRGRVRRRGPRPPDGPGYRFPSGGM
jgi:hypothetical protein